jgi:hypothetical protein
MPFIFENGEIVSDLEVDATAVAFIAQDGRVIALPPLLPDDATGRMPSEYASWTAADTGSESQYPVKSPPPKLMEITFTPLRFCLQ